MCASAAAGRRADVARAVAYAVTRGRPLLTYAWEPDRLMADSGPFIRVSATPYEYCSTVVSDSRRLSSIATIGAERGACDYPFQYVEKAASRGLELHEEVRRERGPMSGPLRTLGGDD